MTSIKAILLEYQSSNYLIPAIRFVGLVRPKEIMLKGEGHGPTFGGNEIELRHSLEHSIYCAVLHAVGEDKAVLTLVIPLSKAPKPINIMPQQIVWHAKPQRLVSLNHPDYAGLIAEIL